MVFQKYSLSAKYCVIEYDALENQSPYVGGEQEKSYGMGVIIASVIAALAVVALIIVTALYLKRTTTYKAIISGGSKKKSERPFGAANKEPVTSSAVGAP